MSVASASDDPRPQMLKKDLLQMCQLKNFENYAIIVSTFSPAFLLVLPLSFSKLKHGYKSAMLPKILYFPLLFCEAEGFPLSNLQIVPFIILLCFTF